MPAGHLHGRVREVEECDHRLKHSLDLRNTLALEAQEIWHDTYPDCRKHHEA